MAELVDLLDAALSLSVKDRAQLAERLLASLDDLTPNESEELWAEEAVRRRDEIRSGRARVTPAAEVHEKARKLIR